MYFVYEQIKPKCGLVDEEGEGNVPYPRVTLRHICPEPLRKQGLLLAAIIKSLVQLMAD